MANKIANKIIACFFLLFVPFLLPAQDQKKIDSLKQVIAHTQNDTTKLKALVLLNKINQDREELAAGHKQQIALALQLKEYARACDGYIKLSYFDYEGNNFEASEKNASKAFELARKTNNYDAMGRCCTRMMLNNYKKGDIASAVKYLQEGEQLLLKANNPVSLTRLYCNASEVYRVHNMLDKALEYTRKGYAVAEASGELDPMATACFFLASSLQVTSQYDSAIYYYSQGLAMAQKLGVMYTQGDMLIGLSDVYRLLKKYSTARDYLKQAIAKYDSVKVNDRKVICEEMLAYLDFVNKDFNKVKSYVATRVNRLTADSLENNRYISKWLANLALVDNDIESWEKYSKKYEQAEAVFTNNKIQKNILELEAQYNLSKKESELLQKESENRKRLWIIAALALGLLSITVILFAQYRNVKNKQQIEIQKNIIEKQNALVEERSRIAADMHDDVGAGLSRIRYITSSLQNIEGSSNDETIQKIVSLSDESVEKMNEIIWALNQGNQQLEELIYYTRSQCSEMASNAGIAFVFDLPENIPAITLGWKECRNIYLLVKEAVNNAIKHAEATTITIECSITKELQFTIADNGKGFNPDAVKKNGNGLLNYKKRIEKLNGSYELITVSGESTKLIFSIPLNTAY